MKKIRNFIMVSLMALMMTLMSCGDSTLKTINEKIEKEGTSATFTQKEYAAMVDYVEKNFDKQLEVETKNMDWEESEKYMQKNFPHLDDYIIILAFADAGGELDKSTSIKYNQIIKKVQNKIKDTYDSEF